jgi:hypothetical protein
MGGRRGLAPTRAPRIPGWRRPRSARRSPSRVAYGSPVAFPSSSASNLLLPGRILVLAVRFRLLTQGWDSGSEELIVFHLFRFDVRRSTGRFSGEKRGSINVPWFPRSGAPVRNEQGACSDDRPACRRRKCAGSEVGESDLGGASRSSAPGARSVPTSPRPAPAAPWPVGYSSPACLPPSVTWRFSRIAFEAGRGGRKVSVTSCCSAHSLSAGDANSKDPSARISCG